MRLPGGTLCTCAWCRYPPGVATRSSAALAAVAATLSSAAQATLRPMARIGPGAATSATEPMVDEIGCRWGRARGSGENPACDNSLPTSHDWIKCNGCLQSAHPRRITQRTDCLVSDRSRARGAKRTAPPRPIRAGCSPPPPELVRDAGHQAAPPRRWPSTALQPPGAQAAFTAVSRRNSPLSPMRYLSRLVELGQVAPGQAQPDALLAAIASVAEARVLHHGLEQRGRLLAAPRLPQEEAEARARLLADEALERPCGTRPRRSRRARASRGPWPGAASARAACGSMAAVPRPRAP